MDSDEVVAASTSSPYASQPEPCSPRLARGTKAHAAVDPQNRAQLYRLFFCEFLRSSSDPGKAAYLAEALLTEMFA